MKLATYGTTEGTAAGVLSEGGILDAARLLNGPPLNDVRALLECGPDVLNQLIDALRGATKAEAVPLAATRLHAPVLRPPTIRDFMCYEGHANMGGAWKLPEAFYRLPAFYFSNPLCIYGPGETVPFPSATRKFDYELEIGAVIGRAGSNIAARDAMQYIAGFTIFNDWSSRDLQRDEMAMNLGPAKGKDSASSIGPVVVTCDELAPFLSSMQLSLRCRLRVNDIEWVDGTSGNMQHDWGAMIERASRDSRIVPGDVIAGGTVVGGSIPEALRLGKPARYLQPGDVVEIEVEGIGILRNTLGEQPTLPEGYRFLPPIRNPSSTEVQT